MSDEPAESGKCLLKLQIGPVQEFIAQARGTRDLWSGSYLLSWLMAAGLEALEDGLKGPFGDPAVAGGPAESAISGEIIFPAWENQPLRQVRQRGKAGVDFKKAAIPNLPNVLLARVWHSKPETLANPVVEAIRKEWQAIAEAVWAFCQRDGHLLSNRDRFDAQVRHFPSISWQITAATPEFARDWAKWTAANACQLAAVRQNHPFDAWSSGGWQAGITNNKDSLNGRDERLASGKQLRDGLRAEGNPLFKHDHDWIGAMTLIKRLWHVAYLPKWGFEKEHFKMPNTPGIADHDPNAEQNPDLHDEDLAPAEDKISELLTRRTYFAVLAFDGDNMGKHLRSLDSDVKHTRFSKELGEFALNKVRPVVESHDGRVIYAGGDDVLALLPADTALPCAEALQKVFHATTGQHASAGIAIAHYKNPLQDVVRAAQAAEKRAKQKLGRAAVAITLLKRSGETIQWGCQWAGGGLELFNAIADALRDEKLSAKFTYALVELLQPYLTAGTPLMKARARENPAEPVAAFAAATVIRRDFDYVLGRQRGPEFPKEEEEPENFAKQLTAAMGQYLEHLGTRYPDDTESQLQEVIGLFRTVSFAPAQFNQRLVRPSPGYGPTSTSSATKK